MAKYTSKKNKIDFVSVSAFLGAILIMPLVLFSGVLKPQVIENQAAGFRSVDVNADGVLNGRDAVLMLDEIDKSENKSLKFDLNGDGIVNAKDYEVMTREMNGDGK